jgi:DNA primase
VEAIQDLAKQVGMIVPQEKQDTDKPAKKTIVGLQDVLQQAAAYFKAELKKSQRAIEYLKRRGLSGQVAAKFQIGYAPVGWQNLQTVFPNYDDDVLKTAGLVVENDQGKRYDRFRDRIMFPIHNQKGEVIGFGGRVINPEDTPKYYNSPETPVFQKGHELYGLFLARRTIREAGRVLVVEGYMDVVALAQYGIDYAVAALGTATTPFHIAKLTRQTDEIVFSFDGDNAGKAAAWRAAMNALPAITDGLKLRFMFLPNGYDPDSYVREFGYEKFELEIRSAIPLSQYVVEYLTQANNLSSHEDRVKLLNDAEPILRQIKAPGLGLMLKKRIAELAQVSDSEMQSLLKLPSTENVQRRPIQRQTRTPLSIKKQFILLALMQPNMILEQDLELARGDLFFSKLIKACLDNPTFKAAALLQSVSDVDTQQKIEIERELQRFEEDLDFSLAIEGARTQLQTGMQKARERELLEQIKEKPVSALTEEEKSVLKKLGSKLNN